MSHYLNEAHRIKQVRRQLRKELDTLRRMWIEGVVSVTIHTRSGALTLSPSNDRLNELMCALRDDFAPKRKQLKADIAELRADHARETAAQLQDTK